MSGFSNEAYTPKVITASGLVCTGAGVLGGFLVSSSSSLTLKAWDALTATGTVIFDTTAAVTAPTFIRMPAGFTTGLYITIGGTGSVSVLYQKTGI